MKHIFVYGGIAVVAWAMWHRRASGSNPARPMTSKEKVSTHSNTGYDGTSPEYDASVHGDCEACDSLGGDSKLSVMPTPASAASPDPFTYAVDQLDYDSVNPFSVATN